jgi:hypothetical protein
MTETKLTAVEFIAQELSKQIDNNLFMEVTFNKLLEQAKEMQKQEKEKLWTNEEVFDMLYKTDKFFMIELREYWKTIEK